MSFCELTCMCANDGIGLSQAIRISCSAILVLSIQTGM